jgi:competence protein ComGD
MKSKDFKTKLAGFTLIEVLIVLGLITFFTFLPTILLTQWQRAVQTEQFLATFEKQLVWAQQNAVIWNQNMEVYFSEDQQSFTFTEVKNGEPVKQEFRLPEGLTGQGPSQITFLKMTGNNRHLGKYIFYWEARNQRIEYQFQLGSGKYVKKIYSL